ncbi:S26 family signal peptidase [Streptomyces cinereoruber]|uniref:S26 family signal peptidase n=1 Tax=Streptomyces cinereoruber TaxID=67260 RepID=UPI00362A4628
MTAVTVALIATAALIVGGLAAARHVLIAVTVHGASMYPALAPGDRILVRRAAAPAARPRVRRVVVLRRDRIPGAGPDGLVVKRVAAGPGDRMPSAVGDGVVPDGHLVVLGDNPHVSTDSRVWGPVPLDSVVGTMVGRLARPGRPRPSWPAPPGRDGRTDEGLTPTAYDGGSGRGVRSPGPVTEAGRRQSARGKSSRIRQ